MYRIVLGQYTFYRLGKDTHCEKRTLSLNIWTDNSLQIIANYFFV